MIRTDIYLTDEQFNRLKELKRLGVSKSFLLREALTLYLNSDRFNELLKALQEDKEDT